MLGLGVGILGKIFGSEKAITGVVGTASKLIDNLSYTDQEKAHVLLAQ